MIRTNLKIPYAWNWDHKNISYLQHSTSHAVQLISMDKLITAFLRNMKKSFLLLSVIIGFRKFLFLL